MKTVALRLRHCRIALGMTQADLALRIRVSRSAVAQWESEAGSLPSTASFTQLAGALGCRFEWLATGRGPQTLEAGEETTCPPIDLRAFARTAEEEQMLAVFRELDEYDQAAVGGLLIALRNRARGRRKEAA